MEDYPFPGHLFLWGTVLHLLYECASAWSPRARSCKGSAVFVPWRARTHVQPRSARRASRPRLMRERLGGAALDGGLTVASESPSKCQERRPHVQADPDPLGLPAPCVSHNHQAGFWPRRSVRNCTRCSGTKRSSAEQRHPRPGRRTGYRRSTRTPDLRDDGTTPERYCCHLDRGHCTTGICKSGAGNRPAT